jgi:hypothetical protein
MILAFSEKINDKPTFFIDKIWYGFLFRKDNLFDESQKYHHKYIEKFKENWDFESFHYTIKYEKIHTIRKDSSNRWKPGNDIHFTINVRTKKEFQFAPVLKCVTTQLIKINHFSDVVEIEIDNTKVLKAYHKGFNKIIEYDFEIETLAKNDGFDSIEDFFQYFNEDFTGKIIHWTNLKY